MTNLLSQYMPTWKGLSWMREKILLKLKK